MHNDTSLELYNIEILYNLYIVQTVSCPNLQLKIPQTSINKGRKTSWRLEQPPTARKHPAHRRFRRKQWEVRGFITKKKTKKICFVLCSIYTTGRIFPIFNYMRSSKTTDVESSELAGNE